MAEVIFEFLKSNDKETQSLFKLGEQVRDALDNECRDSSGWIKIFIGFRTQSGERTDNDIVIFGDLKGKFKVSSEDCLVSSFATVIECKAHSRPNGSNQNIRFVANNIEVRYPNRRTGGYYWENVSAHAAECARSIKSEIGSKIKINTYINDFIWLYNIPNEFSDHQNIFGSNFSALKFFKKIILDAKNKKKGTQGCLIQHPLGNIYRATKDNRSGNMDFKLLNYAKSLSPDSLENELGGLTRAYVERITKSKVDQSKYYSEIGNRMIVFDGGPGTGKTASLLYCAKKLCDEGNKILLLTYNHVLRCDLKRLLEFAKMGLVTDNGVHPKSSVQFFTDIFQDLSLVNFDDYGTGFFEKDEKTNQSPYEKALEKLLNLLKENKSEEKENIFNKIALRTNFDYVMIDESQDWLTLERDIIIKLWTSKRIIIAQSTEQLTRGSIEYTNWTAYLPRTSDFTKLPRRKSLRQGKVLVNFNKIFLDNLNYQSSSLEEEPDMGGGNLIICDGPYTPEIHKRIIDNNLESSKKKYDFSFACHNRMGNSREGFSKSMEFHREGIPLWDACKEEVRRLAPIGEDKHRIMFYESCRGIESWTFVCLEYDKWLEEIVTPNSYEDYRKSTKQLKLNIFDAGGLDDEETTVRKLIARWAMIPLTRAVSTTVIQINSRKSKYGELLFSTLEKIPEESFELISAQ